MSHDASAHAAEPILTRASLARSSAAAIFILFMIASGHLLMVAINALDAWVSRDSYATLGPPARIYGDLGAAQEFRLALDHVTNDRDRAVVEDALRTLEAGGSVDIHTLPVSLFLLVSGVVMSLLGLLVLVGSRRLSSDAAQSVVGVFAGNLIWTGGVEYGLMNASRFLGVAKGVRVHDGRLIGVFGEYVLLKHTWGLIVMVICYLLFLESSRCPVFLFFREHLPLMRGAKSTGHIDNYAPRTAFQYATTIWFFYLLLLWVYDEELFGVHSVVTSCIFFGCLVASVYLVVRLLQQHSLGTAVRYSIGTVVVVWNALEIAAKWNLFKEPWLILHPITALIFFGGLGLGTLLVLRQIRVRRSKRPPEQPVES